MIGPGALRRARCAGWADLPVLAFNLALFAGLTLTGWATWLAARRWTGSSTAALVGGFAGRVQSAHPHAAPAHRRGLLVDHSSQSRAGRPDPRRADAHGGPGRSRWWSRPRRRRRFTDWRSSASSSPSSSGAAVVTRSMAGGGDHRGAVDRRPGAGAAGLVAVRGVGGHGRRAPDRNACSSSRRRSAGYLASAEPVARRMERAVLRARDVSVFFAGLHGAGLAVVGMLDAGDRVQHRAASSRC